MRKVIPRFVNKEEALVDYPLAARVFAEVLKDDQQSEAAESQRSEHPHHHPH